jgi:hypothetical protein
MANQDDSDLADLPISPVQLMDFLLSSSGVNTAPNPAVMRAD